MGFAIASKTSSSSHPDTELQQKLQFAAQNREYDKLLLVIGATLSLLRTSWTASVPFCSWQASLKHNSSQFQYYAPYTCEPASYDDSSRRASTIQFAENLVFSVVQLLALVLLFCRKRWYAHNRTYIMAILRLLEPVRIAMTLQIADGPTQWKLADGYHRGLLPLFWRSIVYVVPMQSHFTISLMDHLCLLWVVVMFSWEELTFGVARRMLAANLIIGCGAAALVSCLQSRALWHPRRYAFCNLHTSRHKGKATGSKQLADGKEDDEMGGGSCQGKLQEQSVVLPFPKLPVQPRPACSLYQPARAAHDRHATLQAALKAARPGGTQPPRKPGLELFAGPPTVSPLSLRPLCQPESPPASTVACVKAVASNAGGTVGEPMSMELRVKLVKLVEGGEGILSESGCEETLSESGCEETLSESGCEGTLSESGCEGTLSESGCGGTLSDSGCEKTLIEPGCEGTLSGSGCDETLSGSACEGTLNGSGCEQPLTESGCEGTLNGSGWCRPQMTTLALNEVHSDIQRSSSSSSSSSVSSNSSSNCFLNPHYAKLNKLENTDAYTVNTIDHDQTGINKGGASVQFCTLPPLRADLCALTSPCSNASTPRFSSSGGFCNSITDASSSLISTLRNSREAAGDAANATPNVLLEEDWGCLGAEDLAASSNLMQSLLDAPRDPPFFKSATESLAAAPGLPGNHCAGLGWLTAQYTPGSNLGKPSSTSPMPPFSPSVPPLMLNTDDDAATSSSENALGMPSIVPFHTPSLPLVIPAGKPGVIHKDVAALQPGAAVWIRAGVFHPSTAAAQTDAEAPAELSPADTASCLHDATSPTQALSPHVMDSNTTNEEEDASHEVDSSGVLDSFSAALLRACQTSTTLVNADMPDLCSTDIDLSPRTAFSKSALHYLHNRNRDFKVLPQPLALHQRGAPRTMHATPRAVALLPAYKSTSHVKVAAHPSNVSVPSIGKTEDGTRGHMPAAVLLKELEPSTLRASTPAKGRFSSSGRLHSEPLGRSAASSRRVGTGGHGASRSGSSLIGGQLRQHGVTPAFPLALMPRWRGSPPGVTAATPAAAAASTVPAGVAAGFSPAAATVGSTPAGVAAGSSPAATAAGATPAGIAASSSPAATTVSATPGSVAASSSPAATAAGAEPAGVAAGSSPGAATAGLSSRPAVDNLAQPIFRGMADVSESTAPCVTPDWQPWSASSQVTCSPHPSVSGDLDKDVDMLAAAAKIAELIPMDACTASQASLMSTGAGIPHPGDAVMLQLWMQKLQNRACSVDSSLLYQTQLQTSCVVVQMRSSLPKGHTTWSALAAVGKSFMADQLPSSSLCCLSSTYIYNQGQLFLVAHHSPSTKPVPTPERPSNLSSTQIIESSTGDQTRLPVLTDASNLLPQAGHSPAVTAGRKLVFNAAKNALQAELGGSQHQAPQALAAELHTAGPSSVSDSATWNRTLAGPTLEPTCVNAPVMPTSSFARRRSRSEDGTATFLASQPEAWSRNARGRHSCDGGSTGLDALSLAYCNTPVESTGVWLWPPAIPAGRAALVEVGVCTSRGMQPGLITPGLLQEEALDGQDASLGPSKAAGPCYVRVVMTCRGDVLADVELMISSNTKTCRVGLPALKALRGIDVWVLSAGKTIQCVYGRTTLLVLPDEGMCKEVSELYHSMIRNHAMETARKLASQSSAMRPSTCKSSSMYPEPHPSTPHNLSCMHNGSSTDVSTGLWPDVNETVFTCDESNTRSAACPPTGEGSIHDRYKRVWMEHFCGLLQDLDVVLASASSSQASHISLNQPRSCSRLDLIQLVEVVNRLSDLLCRNQAWGLMRMLLSRLRHSAPAVIVGMGLQTPSAVFRPMSNTTPHVDYSAFEDL